MPVPSVLANVSLTRFAMYESLRTDWLRVGLADLHLSVLSVSGSAQLCHVLGFADNEMHEVAYPQTDLTQLPFDDQSFDVVVSDQVLEHVGPSVQAAVAETSRVLRIGGRTVCTTCLLNPVHPSPEDYWRFTPSGLDLLYSTTPGLRVMAVEGWGNRTAVLALASGLRHARLARLPASLRTRLLKNDWRWPVVTWVVAERISTGV